MTYFSKQMTLDMLKTGCTARIKKLHSADSERRRLLDLGILPGTKIENVMPSPLGDPTAYLVRNSIVALRLEQARKIEIQDIADSESK